ncbi:MAG: hypothetical protein ACRDH9_03150 [Actinomycetota bacterium]
MSWTRWLAAGLSIFEAGYMVVDGSRALIKGEYFTPSKGEYAGRLGPWAGLVRRIGIDPNGTPMRLTFVIYGLAWLAITAAFLAGAGWGRIAMLVAAIGSLWYLIVGTVTSLLVIVLLLLPLVRT